MSNEPNWRTNARPLSAAQERKLVDFLEERFLDVTRNFKKRSDPSTTLPTLSAYLTATHTLLSLVLQIPPIDPSASLRTALLLRLSGEVMDFIPGYQPDVNTLRQLLDWLDDLDKAWLAVLRSQVWDTEEREGRDLILEADPVPDSQEDDGIEGQEAQTTTTLRVTTIRNLRSSPPTQTERIRLRSLLIGGTAKMEEWLVGLDRSGRDTEYEAVLESMGLQQGFDDLFSRTLAEMGSLGGAVNVPEGMEGTC